MIEDNDALRSALINVLNLEQFQSRGFYAVEDFLASADSSSSDIIISDVNLSGADGFSLLDQLSARGQKTPVILMSADGRRDMVAHAREKGAFDFLSKPFEVEVLWHAIERASATLDSVCEQ